MSTSEQVSLGAPPAGAEAAQARALAKRNAQRRAGFLRQILRWHWISAAICLIGMLLFAITGITLNHAGSIPATPRVTERTADLPADLLPLVQAAEAEEAAKKTPEGVSAVDTRKADGGTVGPKEGETPPAAEVPRRFYGSVELDATRLGRDASQIAEEVIQHLTALVGSTVRLTLEIEANIPSGAPDNVVRTVSENCRTLRFKTQGFEKE